MGYRTKRWSVLPPTDKFHQTTPVSQDAYTQSQLDTLNDKAENAFEMASDAQEKLTQAIKSLMTNKAVLLILIACFIIFITYNR